MTTIRTILCAYDFSETAELALAQALQLARRHDARLVVGHVVESIPVGTYTGIRPLESDLEIRRLAQERLDEVVDGLRTDERRIEPCVRFGDPGAELVELAGDREADLLVIGTRGLTGVRHVLLGSTAEYVVRRAAMPVLTVHPEDALLSDTLQKIVVPTDLSPSARIATDVFSGLLAHGRHPRLLLAFAQRSLPYLEPFQESVLELAQMPDPLKADILARMQPMADALEQAGFEVECRLVDGEPAERIPELAAQESADLIVLSTHGRNALANTLLGRTAQRIVQLAPCPTLTVRATPLPEA